MRSAYRALLWLALMTLGAAVVLVSMQVILRYGFNRPQAWAEEVGRYLFVWSVYLGSVIALIKSSHIRVNVVVEWLGPKAETASEWLNWFIGVLSFIFVTVAGYRLAYINIDSNFYTLPALPRVIFYLAVPVAFTLMTLILLLPRKLRAMLANAAGDPERLAE
jgi:C4-dicarboxylate transporter DctQ subunit